MQRQSEGTTTVRVHYDAGWGHRVTLRGRGAALSWDSGVEASWTPGHVWTYQWPASAGSLEFKPLLDDAHWSVGGNHLVRAGDTLDVYPFFRPGPGSLHKVEGFHSPQLGNSRCLRVYLPPGYEENPLARYPVLYMHDGQNVFEDSTSFSGVSWGVSRTSEALLHAGEMEPAIVVGIDNAGPARIFEYAPGVASTGRGGGADLYGRFLVETLKPWVDAHLRTRPGREDTALMGSSLGGLISFYLGLRHPGVFSKVACLSSSFGWNGVDLYHQVATSPERVPHRVYLDAGTQRDPLTPTQRMRDVLRGRGYVEGEDLCYFEHQGGRHTEASWAERVHRPLRFLFPWRRAA